MSRATNPAVQERLRGLERRKQLRQDEVLRKQMSTPDGRAFMFRVVDGLCGVLGLSFTGDRQTTDFKEGRRSVGVGLVQEIQRVCPEQWRVMWAEQEELQTEDRHYREKAEQAPG